MAHNLRTVYIMALFSVMCTSSSCEGLAKQNKKTAFHKGRIFRVFSVLFLVGVYIIPKISNWRFFLDIIRAF